MTHRPLLLARLLVALGVAFCTAGVATATTTEASELFADANATFERALQEWEDDQAGSRATIIEALATYYAIAEEGTATAAVFANAGNAALLLERHAEAVLAFRRALRIDPTDRVARAGLAEARGRVGPVVPKSSSARAADVGLAWRPWVSGRTLTIVALACWALAWLSYSAASLGAAVRLRLLPLVVVGTACGTAAFAEQVLIHNTDAGVLLRETPGIQGPSPVVFESTFDAPLPAGTEFTRHEARTDWWRVSLADGTDTWIDASSAELVAPDH